MLVEKKLHFKVNSNTVKSVVISIKAYTNMFFLIAIGVRSEQSKIVAMSYTIIYAKFGEYTFSNILLLNIVNDECYRVGRPWSNKNLFLF